MHAAHYRDGVRVLDLTMPAAPAMIGYYKPGSKRTGNASYGPHVRIDLDPVRKRIYAADSIRGLIVPQGDATVFPCVMASRARGRTRSASSACAEEIHELVGRRVLVQNNVGRDRLEPLAYATSRTTLALVTRRDALLMIGCVAVFVALAIAVGDRIGVNGGQGWDGMDSLPGAADAAVGARLVLATSSRTLAHDRARRVLPDAPA
jgi:hypothetical protein